MLAPSPAKRRAMALPMPLAAPVITATLSGSLICYLVCHRFCFPGGRGRALRGRVSLSLSLSLSLCCAPVSAPLFPHLQRTIPCPRRVRRVRAALEHHCRAGSGLRLVLFTPRPAPPVWPVRPECRPSGLRRPYIAAASASRRPLASSDPGSMSNRNMPCLASVAASEISLPRFFCRSGVCLCRRFSDEKTTDVSCPAVSGASAGEGAAEGGKAAGGDAVEPTLFRYFPLYCADLPSPSSAVPSLTGHRPGSRDRTADGKAAPVHSFPEFGIILKRPVLRGREKPREPCPEEKPGQKIRPARKRAYFPSACAAPEAR